jgi:hypothetical protein
MKNYISIIIFTLLILKISSQEFDSVFLQSGYSNQSFYNLNTGEVTNVDNNDWDIAFSSGGYGSAIRVNSQSNVKLYTYPNGAINDWASLDTIGISNWKELHNSDTSWSIGAFNSNTDAANGMDLGWGIYSTITHHITGDSLHVIKLASGDFKKLQIIKLASGTYNFKYANLDGSNEVVTSVSKSTYSTKNFGYYSIQNEAELDREPISSNWHIVFTKYVTKLSSGTMYGVTGVLSNKDIQIAKAENVDVNNVDHNSHTFITPINSIGYNWKSFNMSSFSYDIQDSLCYFIKDISNNIWKIQLTGFEGSSTGKINFIKESIVSANTIDIDKINSFAIYPNPSINKEITVLYDLNNNSTDNYLNIYNTNGSLVDTHKLNSIGFTQKKISISHLNAGVYFVNLISGNSRITNKLIVQ